MPTRSRSAYQIAKIARNESPNNPMVISKACPALLMAFSKTLLIADVRSLLGRLDAALLTGSDQRPGYSYARIRGPDIAIDQIQSGKEKRPRIPRPFCNVSCFARVRRS